MLDLTVFVMTQFRQLVNCCPDTPILSSASPVHEDFLPAINNCSSDHELVEGVLKTVEVRTNNIKIYRNKDNHSIFSSYMVV